MPTAILSGKSASRSGAAEDDIHYPPDSPFASSPELLGGPSSSSSTEGLTTEQVREAEAFQREATLRAMQRQSYLQAHSDATWALGLQTGWLAVGLGIARRAYRFADPVHSLVSSFAANPNRVVAAKLMSPVTLLGLTMTAVTLWQLPTDVRFYRDSKAAMEKEEAAMTEALSKATALVTTTTAKKDGPSANV